MTKFLTYLKDRLSLRHTLGALALLLSFSLDKPLMAQALRAPASYVPDDDVIVVPVEAKISFYEKYFLRDEKWSQKSLVQQQIRIWQENENMAQRYGMDTQSIGSQYYVPDNDEKFRYIQRSYFRFLQKNGQAPFVERGREITQGFMEWNANDEVNSIDEMEATFRQSNLNARSANLPQVLRENQIGKTKRTRFSFQPRPEQAMMIIRVTGPYVEGRAWIGANRAEFNLQRTFDSTGTRVMMNYYADEGRYLAVIDQPLLGVEGLRLRATSTRQMMADPNPNRDTNQQSVTRLRNDNRLQLIFNRWF